MLPLWWIKILKKHINIKRCNKKLLFCCSCFRWPWRVNSIIKRHKNEAAAVMSCQLRARATEIYVTPKDERFTCARDRTRHVREIIIIARRRGRACYLHAVLSPGLRGHLFLAGRAGPGRARLWRHQHVIDHVRVTSTLFPPRRPLFILVFSTAGVARPQDLPASRARRCGLHTHCIHHKRCTMAVHTISLIPYRLTALSNKLPSIRNCAFCFWDLTLLRIVYGLYSHLRGFANARRFISIAIDLSNNCKRKFDWPDKVTDGGFAT